MLRAIIFDCDGVIADTEPLHFAAFQEVLGEEGIALTKEAYLREYLALDDRGCFIKAHANHDKTLAHDRLEELIRRKAARLEPVMRRELRLFDGVAEFVRDAARSYPLAIASGALKHEVELVVTYGGIREYFQALVSAEDVSRSKPYPDPFLKAHALINAQSADSIQPHECLVIEDSIAGIQAARRAGMKCLAVTNSYSREQLSEADLIVTSIADVSLQELAGLFPANI